MITEFKQKLTKMIYNPNKKKSLKSIVGCIIRMYNIFNALPHLLRAVRMHHQSNHKNIGELISEIDTYSMLYVLRFASIKSFEDLSEKVYNHNLKIIGKKNKIIVAFLVYNSSMWACDSLYHLFETDSRFDPVILVRTEYKSYPSIQEKNYNSTVDYFAQKGYNVVGVKEYEANNNAWAEVGKPDIIFHQVPYSIGGGFDIKNVPLTSLNIYVPYTIAIDNTEHRFGDSIGYKLSWRVFCETMYNKSLFDLHSNIERAIFSGYSKMDDLYDNTPTTYIDNIWKIPEGCDSSTITKIIYAPHHSIYDAAIKFSTFPDNYEEVYQYAKNHPKTTSWIIKPHPSLKMQAIANKVFENEEEYDAYMNKWDALPNAKAVRDGPYYDIFKTSDGMILDSVSFLSEYQYTGKPLLFLTRPEQEFNEYGKELIKILYTTPGNDIKSIEEFIERVLIQKDDYMKTLRTAFFEKYLDYKKYNGMFASEYIYDYICTSLEISSRLK